MRLIDADKLDWWYKGRPIRRVIDEAPTVDAVPVVRCKDCRLWRQWPDKTQGLCPCSEHITKASHFCSYGKKEKK